MLNQDIELLVQDILNYKISQYNNSPEWDVWYEKKLLEQLNHINKIFDLIFSFEIQKEIELAKKNYIYAMSADIYKLYNALLCLLANKSFQTSMVISCLISERYITMAYYLQEKKLNETKNQKNFAKILLNPLKKLFNNNDEKNKPDLKTMAESAGLKKTYDGVYAICSRAMYGDWEYLESYNLKQVEDHIQPNFEETELRLEFLEGILFMSLDIIRFYINFIPSSNDLIKKLLVYKLAEIETWVQEMID